MSYQQSVSSSGRSWAGRPGRRALPIGPWAVVGVGIMALGAGLFALGIFHGFEHGSCSSTGYSAHRGPVPTCGKGTGWWMLMLTAGLFIFGGGAALASSVLGVMLPALFVCIGAPCVALALRGGTSQIAYGASAKTGQIEAGIFGAAFIIAGLVWGVIAARRNASQLRALGWAGLLAALVGVALAFLIAAGIAHAIGKTTTTQVSTSAPAYVLNPAAVRRTNRAIARLNRQARQASRLSACVTAAGIHTARIAACERKYMP